MRARRILGVVLAMTLIISSFAACGQGAAKETTSTTAGGTAGTTQQTTAAAEKPDPFGKYEPAIEITAVRSSAPATVKYADGESLSNNVWTQAYENELGIKVKYLWDADASQWESKTNIMIASSDLPDVFQATPVQFKQLYNSGMLQEMTKAYEDYASPYTKQIILESGPDQFESAKIDGKLMAVPFTGLPKEGLPILYVRSDWLKNLNLPEPGTMDDLLKISQAFAKQDPDGNKKNDTFGLMIDNQFYVQDFLKGFAYGYHAYPKAWIKDSSGKIIYGSIMPEMKTVLLKLQEMYKNGEIDKEFGSKDSTKVFEDIMASKGGMYFGQFWNPVYPQDTNVKNDPKTDWKAFPIVSADDRQAKVVANMGILGYWVVKKDAKNPEAVVKMLNMFTKIFYENTDFDTYRKYVNAEDGSEIWQNALVQAYRGFKNLAGYENINAVLKGSKQASELTPEEKGNYDNIQKYLKDKDIVGFPWNKIYGENGSMGVIGVYKANDAYVLNEFYGAPTPGMTKNQVTLDKLEIETFTKIILGKSIDEFDKFVDQWNKLGGEEITKEVNDLFLK